MDCKPETLNRILRVYNLGKVLVHLVLSVSVGSSVQALCDGKSKGYRYHTLQRFMISPQPRLDIKVISPHSKEITGDIWIPRMWTVIESTVRLAWRRASRTLALHVRNVSPRKLVPFRKIYFNALEDSHA